MKSFKAKALSMLLVMIMALSLCACGSSSNDTKTEPEKTEETAATEETATDCHASNYSSHLRQLYRSLNPASPSCYLS